MEGLSGLEGAGALRSAVIPALDTDASPYTRADLYALLFDDFKVDLDFYLGLAREARGPTLVRRTWPSEMALLPRLAGFRRHEITGGFDGRPSAQHRGLIVVSASPGA